MAKNYGTVNDMEQGAQPSFNNPHLSEAEYAALHGEGNEALSAKVDETNDVDFTLKQGGNASGSIAEQLEKVEIVTPEAKKEADSGMGPFGNPVFVVGLFLVADIGKALFDPFVRGTLVNSGMQGLMVTVLNLVSALIITAAIHGKKGIETALDKKMVIQYAAPAAFFAGSTLISFISNKFLQGALKKVLLQMRIPMTAFLASFITGATYTGLQWLCICLLLCTVVAFNFLNSTGSAGGAGDNIVVGVFLLVLQSFFAVMGSLVAEKFLKKKSTCPFNIQKFQIEAAQIGWALLMGMLLSPLVNMGCDAMELMKAGPPMKYDNYNKSTWWAYNARFLNWQEAHGFGGRYDPVEGEHKDQSLVKQRQDILQKVNSALGQDGYRLQSLESFNSQRNQGYSATTPVTSMAELRERKEKIQKESGIDKVEKYLNKEKVYFTRYRFKGQVNGVGADTLAKNFVLTWGVPNASTNVLGPHKSGAINQVSGLMKSYQFTMGTNEKGEEVPTSFKSKDELWDDSNKKMEKVQVADMTVDYTTGKGKTIITFEVKEKINKDEATGAEKSRSACAANELTSAGSPVAKHIVECDGVAPFATMSNNDDANTFTPTGNEQEGGAYVGKTLLNCNVNGQTVTAYIYPGKTGSGVFNKSSAVGTCDHVQCALTDDEVKELDYMSMWFFIGHPSALKPHQYNHAPTNAKEFFEWAEYDRPYKSWDLFGGFGSFPVLMAILMVSVQSWMSGLITKVVSSLGKNIVQAAATCTVVVLENMLIKTPAEALETDWARILTGTFCVIFCALMFSNLPKAPKKEAPKKEEVHEQSAAEMKEPQIVQGKRAQH